MKRIVIRVSAVKHGGSKTVAVKTSKSVGAKTVRHTSHIKVR